MSRSYIRTLATISFAVVAVASQAAVYSQAIPAFYDNTGGADQTTLLQQFNPSWGTLLNVTISYWNGAAATNTVTNIDIEAGTYNNSAFSQSDFQVFPTASPFYGYYNTQVASDSHSGVVLNPGDSDTVSSLVIDTNTMSDSTPSLLAAWTGLGTITAYQASFGIAGGDGDHQVQNAGFEEAASFGTLTYEYRSVVPAPAAAGTMLIGMIGGFVRRRRSA